MIISDTNFGVSARKIDLRHTIRAQDGAVTLGHHTYAIVAARGAGRRAARAGPGAGGAARLASPSRIRGASSPTMRSLRPADIACAINDLMAARGRMPIATDVGRLPLHRNGHRRTPSLVAPGYYASMGFGVPAGLGVQAASGERPLILVGDGAFQMTGWELGNCRKYGWDPIVIVLNNASWEMLRTFQPESQVQRPRRLEFRRGRRRRSAATGCACARGASCKAALDAAVAARGRFQLSRP